MVAVSYWGGGGGGGVNLLPAPLAQVGLFLRFSAPGKTGGFTLMEVSVGPKGEEILCSS